MSTYHGSQVGASSMRHKAAVQPYDRGLPKMLYRALDAVLPCLRAVYGRFGLTEAQWRVLRVR